MVEVVVAALDEIEATQPGGVHSQVAVRDALSGRLQQLRREESPLSAMEHAGNIVAHIHAQWTKQAGLGSAPKDAAVPDPVVLQPPWLHSFTAEWSRQRDSQGNWAVRRRGR